MKQKKNITLVGKQLSGPEMKKIHGGAAFCSKEERLLCFDSCDAECSQQGQSGFCNTNCECRCY